jgi:hypothetical protein
VNGPPWLTSPADDPLESLRDQADEFADAEMDRLFGPDGTQEMTDLLDGAVPTWFADCKQRISDTKFSALVAEREQRASEAWETAA